MGYITYFVFATVLAIMCQLTAADLELERRLEGPLVMSALNHHYFNMLRNLKRGELNKKNDDNDEIPQEPPSQTVDEKYMDRNSASKSKKAQPTGRLFANYLFNPKDIDLTPYIITRAMRDYDY